MPVCSDCGAVIPDGHRNHLHANECIAYLKDQIARFERVLDPEHDLVLTVTNMQPIADQPDGSVDITLECEPMDVHIHLTASQVELCRHHIIPDGIQWDRYDAETAALNALYVLTDGQEGQPPADQFVVTLIEAMLNTVDDDDWPRFAAGFPEITRAVQSLIEEQKP